ncbi:VOC family protein [Deinococcus multiflagellatus]|uniref:VOC family protein n=1 Tax=Deinococcus multiflagellatus TaxID=1656887 RepID=A0ABW1ZJU5_9DEIO|nr:VOC family protein [Deinococcus multiflagellatus]MBZ9713192.1 VOC family protein [Deinococcus multiflagellatus]
MSPGPLCTLTLAVRDPQASRAFYQAAFGLKDAPQAAPGFVMLVAGTDLTLILQPHAASGAAPQPGGAELGFAVPDVAAACATLRALGAVVGEVQRMGWGEAADARDPDGHALTLFRADG